MKPKLHPGAPGRAQAVAVSPVTASASRRTRIPQAASGLLFYPAPLPEFSAALRQLAAGQIPAIPAALPAKLQQRLTGIVEAIRATP